MGQSACIVCFETYFVKHTCVWFKTFRSKVLHSELTAGCPNSSLHAKKVSYMYQSGNKHENYENLLTNDFVGCKQNMTIMKTAIFLHNKLSKPGRVVHFWQNMII